MKKIVSVFTILLCVTALKAQVVGFLPDDPKIIRNTLPNGLTYYLVRNPVTSGFADFTFVQMTGSAIEDGKTAGMTYLMECMAFTETSNFPDGELFTFMDNIGLWGKEDIVMEAKDYYTSYSFKNVPVSKNNLIVDSVLMAIYNMSSGIIINSTSVERGKNFFRNIFSAEMKLDRRIEDSVARHFYHGTPLAPIPDKELFSTIGKYSSRDVQRFYNQRCRPDMQAIVISGDIDVAAVQSKLNTLFQLVPKPVQDKPEFVKPDLNLAMNGFFYFRDVEADCATITVDFIVDHVAPSLRATAVPIVYDYMSELSMNVMRSRLKRNLGSAGFYAIDVNAEVVPYLNRQAFRFRIKCAPGDYAQAYSYLLTEIERMLRYGITDPELERERERFFFHLERLFESRTTLGNGYYSQMCVDNFSEDYSMVGIEWRKAYIEAADSSLDAAAVSDFIKTVIGDKKNMLVTCSSPEQAGGLEYFMAEATPVLADTVRIVMPVKESRKDTKTLLSGRKFVNQNMGVTSRRLANGATVALKQLQEGSGWIYFEAVARGGLSLSTSNLIAYSDYIDDVARISLVGGKNVFEREQDAEAVNVDMARSISVADRRISGRFHKDYADSFLEMVSMYFKGSAPDDANFGKFRKMMLECAPYNTNSPEKFFEMLHGNDIILGGEENVSAPLERLDYREVLDFVNQLFSNVAEFSFIFVGDVDESDIMASVDRFIAPLPGRQTSFRRNENSRFSIATYDKREVVKVPMSFPRVYQSYKLTFPSAQSVENRALTDVAAKVIEREMVRQLSLYGILTHATNRSYRYPKEMHTIDFQFTTADYNPDLEGLFAEIMMRLANTGVGEGEVGSIRQNFIMREEMIEKNDCEYWIRMLRNRYVDRKDFYTNRKDALNAVTADNVNALLKEIIETGRLSELSVIPEE